MSILEGLQFFILYIRGCPQFKILCNLKDFRTNFSLIHDLYKFIPLMRDAVKQKALSEYIKRYAWKNAKTDDLWAVISEESGTQINLMMDTWTKQMGYPVIYVKSRDTTLEFEQVLKLMKLFRRKSSLDSLVEV